MTTNLASNTRLNSAHRILRISNVCEVGLQFKMYFGSLGKDTPSDKTKGDAEKEKKLKRKSDDGWSGQGWVDHLLSYSFKISNKSIACYLLGLTDGNLNIFHRVAI